MEPEVPTHGQLIRARLLDLARRDPGICLAEAGRALGLDTTSASYHARILAREGRLVLHRTGRVLAMYVPGDGTCPWMRGVLPWLRAPDERAAARMLLEGPVAPGRLARAQGLRRHRASRVLRRLELAGAAERTRSGLAKPRRERMDCLERALQRQRCKHGTLCRAHERNDTLSPSPSGSSRVSTPGVDAARRL